MHAGIKRVLFAAVALPSCCALPAVHPEEAVRQGLNDRFLDEDLVVDDWVARFEVESREVALQRDAIVAALELSDGEHVADVGAGTGLFLEPFSKAVGEGGRLYPVEISPRFVDHLRQRAQDESLGNVRVTHCSETDSGLQAETVDAVFICDTYHHFTYPMTTLSSLHRAIRPGGRLYLVDFERIPGVSSDWLLGHVRADKATFRAEVEAAGFTFEEELSVGLKENYMLRFRR
ncbi:MAG: methyltransferase domain-containing protein [Dehalococcoidia bacterium]|nr:methyltransferase domain-containing protein [Dehalococcoidia bacterium]